MKKCGKKTGNSRFVVHMTFFRLLYQNQFHADLKNVVFTAWVLLYIQTTAKRIYQHPFVAHVNNWDEKISEIDVQRSKIDLVYKCLVFMISYSCYYLITSIPKKYYSIINLYQTHNFASYESDYRNTSQ